jgi:hypothetical protein
MSETISLEWIGSQLRAIQAEQRTIRAENEIFRTTVLNALSEVVRVLNDRIGNFEALSEARVDRLETTMAARLDRLGTEMAENNTRLRLELAEHTAQIIVAIEGLAKP